MQPDSDNDATPNEAVLNELDLSVNERKDTYEDGGERSCRRGRRRREFRTSCDVWFFDDAGGNVGQCGAQARDLSERGLGLLVRRLINVGSPIEVRLRLRDCPATYLGGLVVHCRYASDGLYEVGIALKVSDKQPIFSRNPAAAVSDTPWIQRALRSLALQSRASRAEPLEP